MTVVPYQKNGVPASAGLSVEDCEKAAWAYEAGEEPGEPRRRWRGAGAINASLAVALGSGLPLSFYELPIIGPLQHRAYDFIAAHRGKLPGDKPYCKEHPEECQ